VAVVGNVRAAESIALAFDLLPQAELRWVCNRHWTGHPGFARRPEIRCTDRIDEILEDEKVDAIAIAAPVAERRELVAAALEADKHVYVNGALASQADQAEKLLQQARRRGRCLIAGELILADPAVDLVADLIRGGELGEVLYVRGERQIFGRARGEDDLLWGAGAAHIALVLHILGDEPVSVEAQGEAYLDVTAPDLLHCSLSFATGINAQIELSALDPRPLSRLAVVGTKATAVLDSSSATSAARLAVFAKGAGERGQDNGSAFTPGDIFCPQVTDDDPVRRTCVGFLDAIRTGAEPAATARTASIVAALEGIGRSLVRAASVELGPSRPSQDLRLVSAPPAH
jgi:predicted dehydrogenase